jgi:ubiquinone/menaquinone biosynthesis C-methylase UbiE
MTDQKIRENHFMNAAEKYERFFVPVIAAPVAADLVRFAGVQPGERVIDIGCGTGIVARLACPHVGRAGKVAGVDINSDMLAVARSIALPQDVSIEWYQARAEAIPFPAESFDLVLCQMSLQFFQNKLAALREMRRILVREGRLFLNLPGPESPIFSILAEALGRHISAEAAGFVHLVFSLHDTTKIQRLIRDAGFQDVTVQANKKTFPLPAPRDFLWQYVQSTPLASIVMNSNSRARPELEKEILSKWQDFVREGQWRGQQQIVVASARKAG